MKRPDSETLHPRWRTQVLVVLALMILKTPALQAQISQPQFEVSLQEATIQMADGVLLAVDLYLPTGTSDTTRFPVLLEYLPYRKDEARAGTLSNYSYFVERGYVFARVDIRGTGNSEGRLIPYEYSEIEQRDGEAVIDWLSKQSWSNGKVGMLGISWGGFNAIHMAMRNPPALGAILAIDATDDLYQDDVHFMDGILHLDSWEMSQDLANARPGAPDYVIDDAYFRDRFDTEPWMLTYKKQQRDGPFWKRTSLVGRYEEIRVPTFLIGGWYDGYRDSIPRMLEKLQAPVKAIVGPWSHNYPHDSYPKPGMEWRHEAVRWFDHWLKGRDTGVLDDAAFAVYIRDWHPPGPHLETAPGSWRYEDGWPIERTESRVLYPTANHDLLAEQGTPDTHSLRYIPTVGVEAGGPVMWWGDVAHDQRPTDAYSLVYDSGSLEETVEILGFPTARLRVSTDGSRANWFARLSDVAPDGTVTLVAGAGFNGTHRQSATQPVDLVPGETIDLEIEMHFTSWVFRPGHRIRLSINNSQWPMLWPTPQQMTTKLEIGAADGEVASRVVLPVVPFEERPTPRFLEPEEGPKLEGYESLDLGTTSGFGEISSIDRNPQTGTVTVTATNDSGRRYPWGEETTHARIVHRTSDAHPEETSVQGEHKLEVVLDGRTLEWSSEVTFRSDLHNFFYTYTRKLIENGKLLREKTWTETIPRDFQ